jgi:hypothetical protein
MEPRYIIEACVAPETDAQIKQPPFPESLHSPRHQCDLE